MYWYLTYSWGQKWPATNKYLPTYSLLRPEAHRASTSFLHCSVSLAFLSSSFHVGPISFNFDSTILLQVVFGRRCFLLPSGVHLRDTLVMLFVGFLSTCPIHRGIFRIWALKTFYMEKKMIIFSPKSGSSGIGHNFRTCVMGDFCRCSVEEKRIRQHTFFSSYFNSLNVKLLFISQIFMIEHIYHRVLVYLKLWFE